MRLNSTVCFLGLFLVLLLCNTCLAAENLQPLLPLALNGAKMAAERVATYKGTIKTQLSLRTSDGGLTQNQSNIALAYSKGMFRIDSETTFDKNERGPGNKWSDPLYPPGKRIAQSVSFDGNCARSLTRNDGITGGRGTAVWRSAIKQYDALSPLSNGLYDLDKMLAAPADAKTSGPQVVAREVVDGDDCIVVESAWKHGISGEFSDRIRVWVNPSKGYTMPLIRCWAAGGIYKHETLIAEKTSQFRQYTGDVWCPTQVVHDEYRLDEKTGATERILHKSFSYDPAFAVNVPVGDKELGLGFPSGTKVSDQDLDAVYVVP